MGVRNVAKRHFAEGFNVKKWLGYNNLKKDTHRVKNIVVEVLNVPPSKESIKVETFEECLVRLNLSEADVQKRMKSSWLTSMCFLVLAILVLFYGFYQWSQHLHRGFFLCFILFLLLCSFSFREHFHYFQMKKRKLGSTVFEWFKFVFLGR